MIFRLMSFPVIMLMTHSYLNSIIFQLSKAKLFYVKNYLRLILVKMDLLVIIDSSWKIPEEISKMSNFNFWKKVPHHPSKARWVSGFDHFYSKMDRKYIRLYFSLESILKNIIKPLRATRQENDKHYHGAKSITIPILRFLVVKN